MTLAHLLFLLRVERRIELEKKSSTEALKRERNNYLSDALLFSRVLLVFASRLASKFKQCVRTSPGRNSMSIRNKPASQKTTVENLTKRKPKRTNASVRKNSSRVKKTSVSITQRKGPKMKRARARKKASAANQPLPRSASREYSIGRTDRTNSLLALQALAERISLCESQTLGVSTMFH